MSARAGMLTLPELRELVDAGTIDTIEVVMTDMQARLQGKRVSAEFFLDEAVGHDAEACSYLLAVDVDMNTVDGYTVSSWAQGYGDFVLKPDLDTLRMVPWQPGTVMVLCDVMSEDGSPVPSSPRQILAKQLGRLKDRGLDAFAGTE